QTGGILGTDAVWKWYSDANYSTPVAGTADNDGNVSVSPTVTTTYYLRAENTADPCTPLLEGPTDGITVTVNDPVVITKDLEEPSVEICAGFPIEFSIEATGTGLIYEWTLDG